MSYWPSSPFPSRAQPRRSQHRIAQSANHEEIAAATKANGDFAVELYQQLAKEEPGKNLFFSPSSISSASRSPPKAGSEIRPSKWAKFSGFQNQPAQGADASTRPWDMVLIDKGQAALSAQFNQSDAPRSLRDRIAKLRSDLDAANAQTRDLEKANKYADAQKSSTAGRKVADELNKLLTDVDQYELRVAAALWLEKTFPFRPAYLNAIKTYYGGDAFPVDFRQNAESARKEINGWVEKQTKDRIKDLLAKGTLTGDTSLVITSAVYFKGQWSKPFEESSTKNEDFTSAGAQSNRPE